MHQPATQGARPSLETPRDPDNATATTADSTSSKPCPPQTTRLTRTGAACTGAKTRRKRARPNRSCPYPHLATSSVHDRPPGPRRRGPSTGLAGTAGPAWVRADRGGAHATPRTRGCAPPADQTTPVGPPQRSSRFQRVRQKVNPFKKLLKGTERVQSWMSRAPCD